MLLREYLGGAEIRDLERAGDSPRRPRGRDEIGGRGGNRGFAAPNIALEEPGASDAAFRSPRRWRQSRASAHRSQGREMTR